MLRGVITCARASTIAQVVQPRVITHGANRAWVGCSHWTTPFRPAPARSMSSRVEYDESFEEALPTSSGGQAMRESGLDGVDADLEGQEGITIDSIAPSARDSYTNEELNEAQSSKPNNGSSNPTSKSHPPGRPQLPTSIKKLNRLLSHSRNIPIPESDLIETFVRGRGPGGQAINKTNSSVSLIHIPTGIRIQSQPTRSREENRKIARKILEERLDLLRARAAAEGEARDVGVEDDTENHTAQEVPKSKKEKEKILAGQWSRDEIRWEKERRRKLNKAKKAKKKHGSKGVTNESESESDE